MTRRIIIAVAALIAAAATLNAQPEHNDTLRTVTWSIYAQGGVSGFHGMRGPEGQYTYDRREVAPAADVGFFLYPRPWIRFGLGANYTYLKQSDPDVRASIEEIKNYTLITPEGRYVGTLTNESARIQNRNFTHVVGTDLTLGINFMEIWRERKAQWFNIWVSAGIGYMHGWNNYTQTVANDYYFISNDGAYSKSGSDVVSPVSNNSFDAPYIPAALSLEFDIIPQLSLALYGQYKYFPCNIAHTPTGIWTAGAGVRINLVGKKQGFKSKQDRIDELESQLEYYKVHVDTVYVEVPVAATGKLVEVNKPLSHYAVQIYAFRKYQHAPDDAIFFGDNPTIYNNKGLRRYVVFTGTLDEAKNKLNELVKRYHDAFIVYIDDDGVVIPYE